MHPQTDCTCCEWSAKIAGMHKTWRLPYLSKDLVKYPGFWFLSEKIWESRVTVREKLIAAVQYYPRPSQEVRDVVNAKW